jgi:glycerol-3-phosphate dehydrogenase (NAD(P)+)
MPNVLIIGAGAMGQAMGKVLSAGHATISYFDIDPAKCQGGCVQLESAVPAANFIFLCVPSWVARGALAQVAVHVKPATVVISMAKGLEPLAAKSMDELCAEVLPPGQPVAVLGGALLAHEIAQGLPGMGVLGCKSGGPADEIMALMLGSNIYLSHSVDPHGVALAGVFKNVYALALGMSDGLGLGANMRGWLAAQSLQEMLALGYIMNIDLGTLMSVAGAGDLVATGFSTQSKNHSAGVELARTGRTKIKCEGLASLPLLLKKVGQRPGLNILAMLEGVIQKGQNARLAMRDLLR